MVLFVHTSDPSRSFPLPSKWLDTEGALTDAGRNVSLPPQWQETPEGLARLARLGLYPLTRDAAPAYDANMSRAVEQAPALDDGAYHIRWTLVPLTAAEQSAAMEARRADMVCTALQGMLAIDAGGLADAFSAWAADSARTFAERAFLDKAQTWRRTDPTLTAAAAAFGLSDEQLDGLFALAATL